MRTRVEAQRHEQVRLREAIRAATLARDLALGLLRADEAGPRLAVWPWLAANLAALSALFAAFSAYVSVVSPDPWWTTWGLVAVVASMVAGHASRRPGAGGRARARLRHFASLVSMFAAVALLLAVRR